ncbi:gliding motility-associated C-terminal domain-containing protein [Tunicatimonas pelagia]|uniref:T9SS type B sorting domain-containing protein n=1 Tax=Tunicatimonas pelagia TaxID=931531 RepID=UPI002666E950|nr:gliding motility-associated C-terminal domain-containing protein [Tunicatimonas pelagia]WKN44046.1 gliding motility-associated C-terminal domain-containing protein [Tunicatimonas pelagia]
MPIKRFYVLLLCWIASGVANAQITESEPTGNFGVDKTRGCAPLTVTVTDLSDPLMGGPRVYNFDYSPGDRIPVNPTNITDTTYAIPGSYLIIQVLGSQIDSVRIEVLEPRTPQFQLLNCTENRVFVDIQDDYYDLLEIDFGDGTPLEIVDTDQPSFIHQYANDDEYTVNVRGLFNVPDNSGCADSAAAFTTFAGGAFPVATLSEVEILDEASIRVAYSLPDENVSYQLQVTEEDGSTTTNYPLAPGSTELVIEQGEWNTREDYFCMVVVAVDPCEPGNSVSSNEICSIALEAIAEDLQNNLSWQTEPGLFDQYQIFRDGEVLVTSVPTNYEDIDVVCQQPYLYQIVANDGVGASRSEAISLTAISTTVPEAVPNLTAGLQDVSITLTWPETTGDIQQYYIYRRQEGAAVVRYDSVTDPDVSFPYIDSNVEVDQEYCYQISYTDECGNESVLSEEVCQRVPARAQVYFPNAFTPNGDGLNDIFLYQASLLESITFEVFNRWGELIFHTDRLDVGWDGTYNGGRAPEGTYLYLINVTDQLGNQFTQHGKFVLLNPNIR